MEKAKALLAEAGYPDGISLEVQVPNSTEPLAVMQVVQAMAAEAMTTAAGNPDRSGRHRKPQNAFSFQFSRNRLRNGPKFQRGVEE